MKWPDIFLLLIPVVATALLGYVFNEFAKRRERREGRKRQIREAYCEFCAAAMGFLRHEVGQTHYRLRERKSGADPLRSGSARDRAEADFIARVHTHMDLRDSFEQRLLDALSRLFALDDGSLRLRYADDLFKRVITVEGSHEGLFEAHLANLNELIQEVYQFMKGHAVPTHLPVEVRSASVPRA